MNFIKLNFLENYSGDEEYIFPHLKESIMIAEFIY